MHFLPDEYMIVPHIDDVKNTYNIINYIKIYTNEQFIDKTVTVPVLGINYKCRYKKTNCIKFSYHYVTD